MSPETAGDVTFTEGGGLMGVGGGWRAAGTAGMIKDTLANTHTHAHTQSKV